MKHPADRFAAQGCEGTAVAGVIRHLQEKHRYDTMSYEEAKRILEGHFGNYRAVVDTVLALRTPPRRREAGKKLEQQAARQKLMEAAL